jgi:predicted permease
MEMVVFGGVTRVIRRQPWLEALRRDVTYALLSLTRTPGRRIYSALAILTLALGVGGTAAAFSVARSLLFQPLPYPHAREIGVFWKKTDWRHQEFLYIRGRVPGFHQVALYRQRDVTARAGHAPARLIPGVAASHELFDVLGVRPFLGRGLQPGDDVQRAEPVAVLSFGLWKELGGGQSIVGTRLTLDGRPHTVVGVMPRGFWFPDPSIRVWTAEQLNPEGVSWNSTLIGRVAAGFDVHVMAAPVARLVAMLDERFDYPAQWDKTKGAVITPLRDDLTRNMKPALLATLGALTLILLIACANVAALMLGQVRARRTELAVRAALGATHWRLVRQQVAEAVLLAVAAGVAGTGLAWAASGVLARALPLGAWGDAVAPGWAIVPSAMGIAVLSALGIILVPTTMLWRGDLRAALGSSRTAGVDGRTGRLEHQLVVAEVALAVSIAAGAALLARSVANLYAIDPGVRTEGLVVADVVVSGPLSDDERRRTITQLATALGEIPGVQSASVTQEVPLRGGGYNLPLSIEGRPDIQGMSTEYRVVTPGYLEGLGVALRSGRLIDETDGRETERVVVINEAIARAFFPGVDPVGRVLGEGDGQTTRVIGVVSNAAERGLNDPPHPVRYVALSQMPWVDAAQSFLLRAAPNVEVTPLIDVARRTIERVAPGVAVQEVTTMERIHDAAVGPARQIMRLLSLLTGLALTLGAVGIYGMLAHFAVRHRRDWAIRTALGLSRGRVVAHVVRHGLVLVGSGIVVGLVATAGLTRVLGQLLYGVTSLDPIALGTAALALLAVGLVAALIPAWRAGTTDPATVLREQ